MKKFDSINIIPFVDVLLVLLAIIIISSTLVEKKIIPLSLASASASKVLKSDDVVLSIRKDGKVYFKKQLITIDALDVKLEKLSKNTFIAINCDKDTLFSSFVAVLDLIKSKKFDNLSIITKDE